MRKTKADENLSSLSLQVAITWKNTKITHTVMCNPYAEEYQNNTVSQISGKISHMRKWLKPGVLSSAMPVNTCNCWYEANSTLATVGFHQWQMLISIDVSYHPWLGV